MSDKTIFLDNGDNGANAGGMLPLLASMFQQRGLDPNMVMAMMNNRGNNGFGGEGGWFIWVIFLFFLMGWGNNGWGGNGGFGGNGGGTPYLGNLINNDAGRELLLSAIQGNGQALGQLATTINCDFNAIQQSFNQLMNSVCSVGNKVDMSGMQVVNAIQAGKASIASQIANCCCENRLATCQQTNQLESSIQFVNRSVERGFAASDYATAQQTCTLQGAIGDNTRAVLAKLDAIEDSRKDREIASLTAQLTAANSRAERQAELAPIYQALNEIQCKQPSTVTIQNPQQYIPVNACVNVPFGFGNGYGYNNGGCGCNSCGY